jgi:hypothetical protein
MGNAAADTVILFFSTGGLAGGRLMRVMGDLLASVYLQDLWFTVST